MEEEHHSIVYIKYFHSYIDLYFCIIISAPITISIGNVNESPNNRGCQWIHSPTRLKGKGNSTKNN